MINNNVTPFARVEEDVCVFFRHSIFNLRLVSICERHDESKTIDARPEIDRLPSPRAKKKKGNAKKSARLSRLSSFSFYFLSSFSLFLVLTVIKLFIAKRSVHRSLSSPFANARTQSSSERRVRVKRSLRAFLRQTKEKNARRNVLCSSRKLSLTETRQDEWFVRPTTL